MSFSSSMRVHVVRGFQAPPPGGAISVLYPRLRGRIHDIPLLLRYDWITLKLDWQGANSGASEASTREAIRPGNSTACSFSCHRSLLSFTLRKLNGSGRLRCRPNKTRLQQPQWRLTR